MASAFVIAGFVPCGPKHKKALVEFSSLWYDSPHSLRGIQMFTKNFRVRMRRWHRWMGVVIGVQLLFWVASGAYFAWFSEDFIKGQDRSAKFTPSVLQVQALAPLSLLKLPENFQTTALQVESTPRGEVYRLQDSEGKKLFFDGRTGASLEVLDSTEALRLALTQEKTAKAQNIVLLNEPIEEYKGQVPVYQILLDDGRSTHLYADPYTGKVITRRNTYWRIYDFLWMLHILDFKERDDHNNAIIRGLSLAALGVIASGYFLFFFGKAPRRI